MSGDYRCIDCGAAATHFTSLDGQAQTFYCCEHIPTFDGGDLHG